MICQTRILWIKMFVPWLKLLCTNNCVVEEFYYTLSVHLN